MSSPPPEYDFAVIPQVSSRLPLWEDRLHESARPSLPYIGPVLAHGREALATTPLDAIPDTIVKMPEDSHAPFILTVAMTATFVGLLMHFWWLVLAGTLGVLGSLVVWLWPRRKLGEVAESSNE